MRIDCPPGRAAPRTETGNCLLSASRATRHRATPAIRRQLLHLNAGSARYQTLAALIFSLSTINRYNSHNLINIVNKEYEA